MGEVRILAGRVHDEEQGGCTFLLDPRDHKIVPDTTGFVEQQRVAHAADIESRDIAGYEPFETRCRVVTAQYRLPHMGYVEQPRPAPRRSVFGDDARRVLDRHRIARERDHTRSQCHMQVI